MQQNKKNYCQFIQTIYIMKKILVLSLASLLFFACVKTNNSTPACTDVDPSAEATVMRNYCLSNSINYTIDSSGIFYQVLDAGLTPRPTANSLVTTTYVGKFLNGNVLDSNLQGYTINLNQLIPAWQIALQKIGKGGHIKVVAPSSLCYGCYGVPPRVPSNSILYFDITLLNVQ